VQFFERIEIGVSDYQKPGGDTHKIRDGIARRGSIPQFQKV
jgi:hypothetical protein